MAEFKAYGKTPRLRRDILVTEKIDGTNGGIHIERFPFGEHSDGDLPEGALLLLGGLDTDAIVGEDGMPVYEYLVTAQSRNRIVVPNHDGKTTDNQGFARWVWDNAAVLVNALGLGLHYGEWYGQGVQGGHGLDHKRFALFAVDRYDLANIEEARRGGLDLELVPVLYRGPFESSVIDGLLDQLATGGSVAVPGHKAEGVIVYHRAAGMVFKALVENDHLPKGLAA